LLFSFEISPDVILHLEILGWIGLDPQRCIQFGFQVNKVVDDVVVMVYVIE
jgi:hypothetical protein